MSNYEQNVVTDAIKFERGIYEVIAGTKNFEVMPIPSMSGEEFSSKEKEALSIMAKENNSEIIYRISYGGTAYIFGDKDGKLALVPENDTGYLC